MASIFNDISDVLNRQTGGIYTEEAPLVFFKSARVNGANATAPIAGQGISFWLYQGQPGSDTALPGAVNAPTNATSGALKQADPGGGRSKYLQDIGVMSSASGTLLLYDRLLHISGLSGTNTGAQTVGGSLTRYTSTASVGNRIYLEINTLLGVTGTTVTASYTNQAGTSGRTTQAVTIGGTGFKEAQRFMELPLAAGDTGVQAVASVTVLASTGTIGDFGIVVGQPIYAVNIPQVSNFVTRDFIAMPPTMPQIQTGACLAFAFFPILTTVAEIYGTLVFIEK